MSTSRSLPLWTIASFIVAVAGNFVAAAFLVAPLYRLPPGSSVRLLAESFHSALATLATLVIVVVLSIIAWRREGVRFSLLAAVCLSLASFPLSGWVMRLIAADRGILLQS